jgi:putative oxidoreductase
MRAGTQGVRMKTDLTPRRLATRLAVPAVAGRVAAGLTRPDFARSSQAGSDLKLARLITRLVIGGLFVGHGTQKLFGWFGGPGLEGTQQMMSQLEMHPPRRHARAAGLTESVSGTLLALGLATPLAAAGIIGVMTTAIRKVHLSNGLWVSKGGYEYNLVLIAALLDLVDGGPGPLSVDRVLGLHDTGPAWALAALGTGVAASAVTIELGRRAARTGRLQAGARQAQDGQRPAGEASPDAGAATDAPGTAAGTTG